MRDITRSTIMHRSIVVGLAMLAGAALGAAAVNGLNAQGRPPGAFAVIDISEITDRDVFTNQLLPKTAQALAAFGGQFVIRTENIIGIEGTPPKRFVVIAFTNPQLAKAWSNSTAQKEIDALRTKSTKSREFIADGTIQ
jgi:uncharacterized protein (DUF1330 family)